MMFPIFLKISLVQNVTECCEKIYVSQLQKIKVEDIISRIVENQEDEIFNKQRFKINVKNRFDYSDLKNSFVEYMVYKLKQKGYIGAPYLDVLEKQVMYTGTTVEEIIRKEHFHIANLKNSIGNSITSIKNINRLNFKDLFEELNVVTSILMKDPAGVFSKMDQDSKDMYLDKISKISKQYKLSEIFIANKLIEISSGNECKTLKEKHVGYYLISEGKSKFLSTLQVKNGDKLSKKDKSIIFIRSTFYMPLILSVLFIYFLKLNLVNSIISFFLSIVLFTELYIKTVMYIVSKIVKPKLIPKINMYGKIEEENATFVVIPTIINSKKKIDELIRKVEVYYLANESKNLYFAILGDCTTSKKEMEKEDIEIIDYGREKIYELNKKYHDRTNENVFFFLYRKRRWNSSEGSFLGWERKRGLLTQFNEYLLNNLKGDFLINTLEDSKFSKKIKYIITLDSDTNLILNSAFKMVGAMQHVLNVPEIENGKIISGYGMMQPKVSTSLKDASRSIFSKIYSSNCGTNLYSNASYDFYQDVFEEAIFTGKGIYNLEVYSEIMKNKINENEVLSHDLLESNYLRCAFLSDVTFIDSYPYKVTSYLTREHRWIRGDWQLIRWLRRNEKDINLISKYKIYDNLRRSLLVVASFFMFLFSLIINSPILMTFNILIIYIQFLFDILDKIIFRKSTDNRIINASKNFEFDYSGLIGNFVRTSINFAMLPALAYISLNAIIKTIYRLIIKRKLLEWITSEDAEKMSSDTLESYYKMMWANLVVGIIIFGFLNPFAEMVATIWILSPFFAWFISIENKEKNMKIQNEKDIEYLLEIGKRTWKYFEDYLNENTSFLPPDNYQEDRKNKIVYRTSSTNIGLAMLSCISAYDLNYIDIDKVVYYLENILSTIKKLDKWNGHLYNWYDLKTLNPLTPRYISSVDSGNFVGYLYVVRVFLEEVLENNNYKKIDTIKNMIEDIKKIILESDFSCFYNDENKLFSIGYDIESMSLSDSYYDFLASEARQASFIAIAKKDIDEKHWSSLSRTLATTSRYKGLISWSGTAFEYLMPTININSYPGSVLNESCKFMIMAQRKYCKKYNVPWGISEAAYSVKDLSGNYQYKAFGIPILGLKRGLEDELVVSPYSAFLALRFDPEASIENMKLLEKNKMFSKYGFYESIDYTKSRLKKGEESIIVKTYMAHHQGLIIAAINNLINKNTINERFFKNPEIESVDILLQEKMPNSILISKNRNESIKKEKYINEYYDKTIVYSNPDNHKFNRINVISSDDYQIVSDLYGNIRSMYKDIQINRYYENSINKNINGFWIKDITSDKIYSTNDFVNSDRNEINFSSSINEYKMDKDDLSVSYKITTLSSGKGEIRRLEIENYDSNEKNVEVMFAEELILSTLMQDVSHPAFNNMFLEFEYIAENDLFIVKRRDRDLRNDKYAYKIKMYVNKNEFTQSDTRYEIDKEKFCKRKNNKVPDLVINSDALSSKIIDTVNPILAINKKYKLSCMDNEKLIIDMIISVEDNDLEKDDFSKYENIESRNNEFILSKAKAEEEIKYLKLNGDKIETYQKILGHLIKNDIPKEEYLCAKISNSKNKYQINDLWKFGISCDNKILCVRVKNIDDLGIVKELLSCIEFFRLRRFNIDLCILNAEKNSYDMYLRNYIIDEIRNMQLEFLINKNIFIIDECKENEDILDLIHFKSDLFINIKFGSLKLNIDDIENHIRYQRPIKKRKSYTNKERK